MTKTNIFSAAKKKETTKKATMPEITMPELENELAQFSEAKGQIDAYEAQKKMSEGIIKDRAREAFLLEYLKEKRNIGSFKIVAGSYSLTCSVKDQYLKLDADSAEKINTAYPDTVETKTTYSFNSEILEKYIDQISEALMNANIPEDAKANLLESKEDYIVKKGSIDRLLAHGEQKAADFFTCIAPIVALR